MVAAISSRWLGALLCAAALIGLGAPGPTQAQDYPVKPVRLVVGTAAGGVVDIRARKLGPRLGEILKQPIVVDNKPGASYTIAAEHVARSAPDGYTVLFGGNNELVVVPALGTPIRYDPLKDFIPVAQFSLGYGLIVAHAGLGVRSIPELIAWARANPGKLLCGTAGHGSGQHFTCELLARAAGIEVRSIHYKGTGPMLVDLASGQVHIGMGFLAELDRQYIQTGKALPLASLSNARLARFPQVPSMTELGYAGFERKSWTGLFVPAGTPKPIVDKLNAAVARAVREPEMVAWLAETGSEAVTPNPEQFRNFARDELERWRKLSNDFGIKAEQ